RPSSSYLRLALRTMYAAAVRRVSSGVSLRSCSGFELIEQGIEALEAALPETAVALQPRGGFRERLGLEPAGPSLGVAAVGHQAGSLQHLEVLGDRRLAHREWPGQLRHRRLPRRAPGEDGAPRRIGECREGRIEAMGGLHN